MVKNISAFYDAFDIGPGTKKLMAFCSAFGVLVVVERDLYIGSFCIQATPCSWKKVKEFECGSLKTTRF